MRTITMTATLAAVLLSASAASAQQAPIPSPDAPTAAPPPPPAPEGPQYITREKPITGLIIAGSVTFGVVWLSTIAVTAGISAARGSDQVGKNTGFAAIPIAGPLIQLADPEEDKSEYAAPLVVSTVLQTSGLVMLIVGAAVRTKERVPVYSVGYGVPDSDADGLTLTFRQ